MAETLNDLLLQRLLLLGEEVTPMKVKRTCTETHLKLDTKLKTHTTNVWFLKKRQDLLQLTELFTLNGGVKVKQRKIIMNQSSKKSQNGLSLMKSN